MILDVELEEGENNMEATYCNIKREGPYKTENDILNAVVRQHRKPFHRGSYYGIGRPID